MNNTPTEPVLELNFLSHGTLIVENLERSRKFFEEFLGLETVKTARIALAVRLNSNTSVACVEFGKVVHEIEREGKVHSHFGLDMGSAEEVRQAHRLALEYQDEYHIRQVDEIIETDSGPRFMIEDMDRNCWEILCNKAGGYTSRFGPPGELGIQ